MDTQLPCQRLTALVSSAPERASALPPDLQEHAERCLACQAEVHASKRLVALLADAAPFEPSPFLAERVLNSPTRPARTFAWRPIAIGALVVAGLAMAFVLGRWNRAGEPAIGAPTVANATQGAATPAPPTPEWTASAPSPVAATAGGMLALDGQTGATLHGSPRATPVTLSDGTIVRLGPTAEARLSSDRPRGLDLVRGEVLIEVVRQSGLPPLDVRVPTGSVRVTGTKVQVAASPRVAVVDVVHGTVIVESAGESKSLGAGGEAVLHEGKPPRLQAAADLAEATRWAETEVESAEETTTGLGTLHARRPGATTDKELALRLADHKVEVRLGGVMSRTEVEETFQNDSGDTLEGTYSFPVPPGARIAALDLLVDGRWQEGAIVERERADKIWAGVIRQATPQAERKDVLEFIWVPGPWRDPALLKWQAGSRFELRIFPIPAHGSRSVRIAWTEPLTAIPDGRRYVYPLGRSETAQADRFRVEARLAGTGAPGDPGVRVAPYEMTERREDGRLILATDEARFAPRGDLVIDVPDEDPGAELRTFAYADAQGAGYALLTLRPMLPATFASGPLDLLFVVDTSYSTQAERLGRAGRLVAALTRELDGQSRVHVLGCADRCTELGAGFRNASAEVATDLERQIASVKPVGGTRLGHAFDRAAAVLRAAGVSADRARIVYLGDGVATVGELDATRLAASARRALGDARLTTVSLGGEVDEVALRALAAASGGAYIAHGAGVTLRATALRVLQRQLGDPLEHAELTLPPGLADVAPATLGDLWPGEERHVTARLTTSVSGEVVLRGTVQGQPFERRYSVSLEPKTSPGNAFLPRLWAERRIDDLQLTGGDAQRDQIVALSKQHHVLSRYTSLLVLESPAMAAAFKVGATRTGNEWTGDDEADGDTAEVTAALTTGATTETKDDEGGTEFAGSDSPGLGGSGRAYPLLAKKAASEPEAPALDISVPDEKGKVERTVRAPAVRMGEVSGGLDTQVFQRVIRMQMGRLRWAYEQALKQNPNLTGRLAVRMTVDGNGNVSAATASASTLPSEVTERILNVMRSMRFPSTGDTVTVVYPFMFQPGDSAVVTATPDPRPRFEAQRGLGRWVAMRKVWYREASIGEPGDVGGSADQTELSKRLMRLREQPESRDRTRDLLRWELRLGDLATAQRLADAWLAKDRLDAGALVALADIAALRGDPDASRDLLASAVEVDPRSAEAHARMVALYDAAGEATLACDHALSRALVAPADPDAQAAAIRCGGDRERHLAPLSAAARKKAEAALAREPVPAKAPGEMTLTASWEGAADLDLVVVTPTGRRVSWQGGAKKTASTDALAAGREVLAMSTGEVGRYQVFLVPRGADAGTPVAANVTIRTHGKTRMLRVVAGARATPVADVTVKSRWRYENAQ